MEHETVIDRSRLKERFLHYVKRSQAPEQLTESMLSMLDSPVVVEILSKPPSRFLSKLVNDLYKPKMHKMYGDFCTGIVADFCLNIRKTAIPLDTIKSEDPVAFSELEKACEEMHKADACPEELQEVLKTYVPMTVSESQCKRAAAHGVAKIEFQNIEGVLTAFAHGPVEAASHTETSMLQLVQETTILAQARRIERGCGVAVPRVERLASSLARLVHSVHTLNATPHRLLIALFAGRRSSDRVFLVLQNLFCMLHLTGYIGTSSCLAVSELDRAMGVVGTTVEGRKGIIKKLVGTHAHEQVSIFNQLLSDYDKETGDAEGPCPISPLVAHLVFLVSNGGSDTATALADTFGTAAFCAAAGVARLPEEFLEDMEQRHGEKVAARTVLELLKVWRLDSGVYGDVAETVVQAFESAGLPPPVFMHSNLGSPEEVVSVGSLPDRIRPQVVGFGSLLDGFLPFDMGEGKADEEIKMCSVVMKAVQARMEGQPECSQGCAGKLGDDLNSSKHQVDPRMDAGAQQALCEYWERMKKPRAWDSDRVSQALAKAYHAVVRERIFCR